MGRISRRALNFRCDAMSHDTNNYYRVDRALDVAMKDAPDAFTRAAACRTQLEVRSRTLLTDEDVQTIVDATLWPVALAWERAQ